jgi:hypothetical protein
MSCPDPGKGEIEGVEKGCQQEQGKLHVLMFVQGRPNIQI